MCVYATNTGEPWCVPWQPCTRVECRNPARLVALTNGERTDGAAFHTMYRTIELGFGVIPDFVIVRSSYCCREHCIDYEKRA